MPLGQSLLAVAVAAWSGFSFGPTGDIIADSAHDLTFAFASSLLSSSTTELMINNHGTHRKDSRIIIKETVQDFSIIMQGQSGLAKGVGQLMSNGKNTPCGGGGGGIGRIDCKIMI